VIAVPIVVVIVIAVSLIVIACWYRHRRASDSEYATITESSLGIRID
jgi:hypothetical protein